MEVQYRVPARPFLLADGDAELIDGIDEAGVGGPRRDPLSSCDPHLARLDERPATRGLRGRAEGE